MGKKAAQKGRADKKGKALKHKKNGKGKTKLKVMLGVEEYKALKKKCCDPKHPHCSGCPFIKALAKLPA